MKSKLRYSLLLLLFFFKGYSLDIPFTLTLNIDGTTSVTIGSLSAYETWQYEYGASGFAEGTGTLSGFTGFLTTSVKLDPFQTWDFRVRKRFSNGTPGAWSQVVTQDNSCTSSPHYVGYSADFDTNPIQQCWRGYKSNTTSSSVQINIENQNYDGNAGKSILMYCGSAYTAMLVSPRLEDLASDKRVKFWLKGNGNNGQVKVGTITNPYDPTTFHELASYTGIGSTSFTQKTLLFNDYNGTDKYIAFKLNIWFSAEACIIDQFSYEQSVNCIPAGNFNISNITEHSAQLNFDTSGQANWELYFKNVLTSQVQTIPITSGNYVLNNLTGNTAYEVKVRANCGDGIYSPWTALTPFTTPCENVVPGYYTGFDEAAYFNPCWTKLVTDTFYNVNLVTSSASIPAASGPNYLSFDGNSSDTYKTMLVSPYVPQLDTNKRIRFKIFDNKRAYFLNYPLTIGTLSNPNDPTTFVPLVTLNPLDVNPVGLYELGSFWQQYIIDFSNYSIPAGHHYIGFKIEPNSASLQQNIAFDDFYFEEIPQCKEPTNIQVVSYDYDKATLSWNSNAATAWQIEYGPSGFTSGTGTIVEASTSPFTLNNLADNSSYDFYVRSVCSGGNSLWSSKGIFKTRCSGVTVGYTTSFENESFDLNTSCWRRTTPIMRNYWYGPDYFIKQFNNGQYGSYNAHTGTVYVRMSGGKDSPDTDEQNKTLLVTPKLLDLDNTKLLKFWAFCQNDPYSSLQQIIIGTMSNPNDYNTFTPFQTITAPFTLNQWKQYTVDFSSYNGTNKYVAIKQISSTGGYWLLVDDFEYVENPCRKPSGLMASQSGQNSATLTWNPNIPVDGSTTWQLEYGEYGFTPGTGTVITVNSFPTVLNNLQIFKKYQFRVRNVCPNSAVNWSDLYPFNIMCTVNAPFYENWDQYESYAGFSYLDPEICWTSLNQMSAGVYQYSQNNINSAPNVGFVESNSAGEGVFVSPYLADFDNSKRIRFWAKLQVLSSSQNLSLIVGTVKNPMDLSTFVPFQTFPLSPAYQSGQQLMVDFSSYTGDSKYFAFKTSGYVSDGGYTTNRIFFDDIYYETIANCSQPLDAHFSQTNHDSTLLGWTNVGTVQSTQIEYGLAGFTPGTGTILNSTSNQLLITGLNSSTDYDFYLTTVCSSQNSLVVGPLRITTTCGPESIPWAENFNGMSQYGLNILPDCWKLPTLNNIYSRNAPYNAYPTSNWFEPDNSVTGYGDTTYLHCNTNTALYTPMFHLVAGTSYKFSMMARKRYEYDFSNVKMGAFRGQESYFHVSDLESEGALTEYEYSELHYFYTPVDTGDYSFRMFFNNSGSIEMVSDNFKLDEGYPIVYDSNRTFDFSSGIDNGLIIENTVTSKITRETAAGNSYLKFAGSTSGTFSSGDFWKDNQDNISKVNLKINSAGFPALYLSFKLKQTYTATNANSAFRLVVNGNTIGDAIYPATVSSDPFRYFVYDLTPYIGSNLRISLQHIGKTTADNAYLDDIVLSQQALGTSSNEINNLRVFPNPTKNKVSISSSETITGYKIYNVSGQLLQEIKLDFNQTDIDLSNYATGIYLINIEAHDKNKMVKIVKE